MRKLYLILLLSMNNLLAQLKATNDTQQTQISSNNHINSSNNEPISDGFLKQALSDSRYLRRQLKCVLGEIPCDLVGRRLKSMIPIILRGGCPQLPGYKCTKNDVAQIKQAVLQVQMKFPREFRKLIKQYSG